MQAVYDSGSQRATDASERQSDFSRLRGNASSAF
jgi:hypothetical protein